MPDRSTGVQQGREYDVWVCVRGCNYVSSQPGSEHWHAAYPNGRLETHDLKQVRVVEAVSPEPREEEQGPPDWNIEGMTEPEAGPPSVASVLRLTASRLRDPEYRWSEDPAVTLERLAEELEREADHG